MVRARHGQRGIVGASTTGFLKLLELVTGLAAGAPHFYLTLPFAFLVSLLLLKYLAPGAEGHGTEKVIEAVRRNGAKVRGTVVPVKLAATLVTITAGGSVGKEGPCARIGAGLSSLFADLLRFEGTDRVKLVVCGISAGFASVFGAPVAGAVFGIEVLYVGRILYDVMFPSFISGIVAYQVASALGVSYFTPRISVAPVFGQLFFVKVILSGVFFGLCSSAFIEFL